MLITAIFLCPFNFQWETRVYWIVFNTWFNSLSNDISQLWLEQAFRYTAIISFSGNVIHRETISPINLQIMLKIYYAIPSSNWVVMALTFAFITYYIWGSLSRTGALQLGWSIWLSLFGSCRISALSFSVNLIFVIRHMVFNTFELCSSSQKISWRFISHNWYWTFQACNCLHKLLLCRFFASQVLLYRFSAFLFHSN